MEHILLHRRRAVDLSPAMLYALLRLRIEVFVVEQSCPHQELDDRDLDVSTRHFWLAPYGDMEQVLATLRLIEPVEGRFRIGRVCTLADFRREGAARRLLEAALAEVGERPCELDAQTYLVDMYRAFGFQPVGEEFLIGTVPHVPMLRARAATA